MVRNFPMMESRRKTDKGGAAVAHDRAALGSKIAPRRKEQMAAPRIASGRCQWPSATKSTHPPSCSRRSRMLTFATTAFSDGTWTITPDEPTSLSLALVGFGAIVVYAALSGCAESFRRHTGRHHSSSVKTGDRHARLPRAPRGITRLQMPTAKFASFPDGRKSSNRVVLAITAGD